MNRSYRGKTAARAPITSAMTTSVLTSPGCEVIAAGGQLRRSYDANLDNSNLTTACIARKLEI